MVVSEEGYGECKHVNKSVIQQPTTEYPFVKYVGLDAVYLFVHKQYKAVYVNIYMDILHSFIVCPYRALCDIANNCIPTFNPTRLMKSHSIVTL